MLYDEFLKLFKCSENDVPIKAYNEIIEPMYMSTTLDKRDFVKLFSKHNIRKFIKDNKNLYPSNLDVLKSIK